MNLSSLVVNTRRKPSRLESIPGRDLTDDFASDRSRIIYSPAFRRLGSKAQVFSLESNAAVRSRITHSLEVSNVGRLIAYSVTKQLIKKKVILPALQQPIILAVECACLAHDIGNPPFGHFGEAAIKKWFSDLEGNAELFGSEGRYSSNQRIKELLRDFTDFDGNPQGLRILLRLKRDRDEYGFNLTYTTILSFIKYCRSATEDETKGNPLTKKAGYFEAERAIVQNLKKTMGVADGVRFPLAFLMEAADDIAYCISDIEDGLEKGILRIDEFFDDMKAEWKRRSRGRIKYPFGKIPAKRAYKEEDFFFFKIAHTQKAISAAADQFVSKRNQILKGTLTSLFPKNSAESLAFETLKTVSRKKLFRSKETENIELAGYKIVYGLLDSFLPLLLCSEEQFEKLRMSVDDPDLLKDEKLDVQWRLFNRLPKKHMLAYEDQLKELSRKNFPEWYLRAHLIVDYVSGMTDHFALHQFQLLSGIRIVQER